MNEIIIDNFAGGGGASTGIEFATGLPVTVAINHDKDAIIMHKANHPLTKHYCESVWDVDPVEICKGRKIALAWFSPDCKHFSKAKGGRPVDKKVRGLAWVTLRWASLPQNLKPRVIILENVEEFQAWGPVIKGTGKPDPAQKGRTFVAFVNALKRNGYQVEWRELQACDYGAPTIRKRFFLVARSDRQPICWPKPTHGPGRKPYRTAAEIINFSLPCPSIFDTKEEIMTKHGLKAVRPLAEATLRRIAKGCQKFVVDEVSPFILSHNNSNVPGSIHLAKPFLTSYHAQKTENESRGQDIHKPVPTIDTNPRYALVTAFISKYFSGGYKGSGIDLRKPLPTVTAVDHNALVTSHLCVMRNNMYGKDLREPMPTQTVREHFAEVRTFLKRYGSADDKIGIVNVEGQDYYIGDIGIRMLTPRELFDAQGFPHDYVIEHDQTGKPYPKMKQTARCGNAVPPPFAEALVRSNLPEMCRRKIELTNELYEGKRDIV
jgi:DNA (cytosine-5)-methyltransferase 1